MNAHDDLYRYQDPTEADKLAKIQKDLDETKVRQHNLMHCMSISGICSLDPFSSPACTFFLLFDVSSFNDAKLMPSLQVILHKTIDEILVRGERLDDLIDKTADLSAQSKQFYTVAKKHNSCCSLM